MFVLRNVKVCVADLLLLGFDDLFKSLQFVIVPTQRCPFLLELLLGPRQSVLEEGQVSGLPKLNILKVLTSLDFNSASSFPSSFCSFFTPPRASSTDASAVEMSFSICSVYHELMKNTAHYG